MDDPNYVDGSVNLAKIRADKSFPLEDLIKQAIALSYRPNDYPLDRFDRLVGIAESVSKGVNKHTPCKEGCSHCCYMSVAMSDLEAYTISRHIGRGPVVKGTIEEFLLQSEQMVKDYAGVPCSFLEDGKCSIYTVRPIACRTHHNLAVDNSNCVINPDLSNTKNTPKLDLRAIDQVSVDIAFSAGKGFADIRQYFPNGRKG